MAGSRVDTDRLFNEFSEREIPVGTTFWTWWFVLPAVSTVITLVLSMLIENWFLRSCCLIVGLTLAIVSIVAISYLSAGRQWLTILPQGFILRTISGTKEYLDEQVLALADARTTQYASGRSIGEVRNLQLRVTAASPLKPIHLRRYLGIDELDLLDVLIERLKCRLFSAAQQALRRQKPLTGQGWTWQGKELFLHTSGSGMLVNTAEISKVRHEDGQLVIWLQGESLASLRFPIRGESGWLLEECLQQHLQEAVRYSPLSEPEPVTPLGRILIERRPSLLVAYSMFALGAFALFVALVCCTLGLLFHSLFSGILGISLGFPAAMVLALARNMSGAVFRFGEQGIEKIGIAGHQRLLLAEVDVLLFESSRQRSYGRYVGTQYSITMASRTDPIKSIFYTESTRNEDRLLLELRDRIAASIARRMAAEWAATGMVRWTPELLLTREGVEFQPQRIYGWRRKPTTVNFSEIMDFEIEEHWFHLWSIAEERAVIKASTGTPNFYPGLVLLEHLFEKFGQTHLGVRAKGHIVT